ncbi:hypothetical protein FOZ63_007438 [Perkinsus olseni]|uniref:Uncharacterized protein n=1 Tax=Perkinsus olseni TaxID=32597 RepID=A0A7J6QGK7_PEROL|nr:hypothetical protein FOZ63_007438 [Perkinsus olseni]KAF4707724.1 hypothetical protein FOZ62_007239 [Perkinsus olseni]
MMNFVSTWLIAAHTLVITLAQHAGKYTINLGPFDISYDVNEEQEVVFILSSNRPGLPNYNNYGPYPLRESGPSTYVVDFKGARYDAFAWYYTLQAYLVASKLVDPDTMPPLAGIQTGDLITIVYQDEYTFTTMLRDEEMGVELVSRPMKDSTYVYKAPGNPPSLEIWYSAFSDPVRIWFACNGVYTNNIAINYYRDTDLPYEPYVVKPSYKPDMVELLKQARQVCPGERVDDSDLGQVVAATDKTIYLTFAGATRTLTKF